MHVRGRSVLLFEMRGFWVTKLLSDGRRKIAENWLFCQHFISRFTENRPDPVSPPRFHGAEEIERVRIDWQTNLFFYSFLAFSFPPEKWYLIWSLFNDPKWLKLHILNVYCWAFLVWYQGPLRTRKAILRMLLLVQQKEWYSNDKVLLCYKIKRYSNVYFSVIAKKYYQIIFRSVGVQSKLL